MLAPPSSRVPIAPSLERSVQTCQRSLMFGRSHQRDLVDQTVGNSGDCFVAATIEVGLWIFAASRIDPDADVIV